MTISFKEFARSVARDNGVESLLPVVEKELIHYDIVRALDHHYGSRNGSIGSHFRAAPACVYAMGRPDIARISILLLPRI